MEAKKTKNDSDWLDKQQLVTAYIVEEAKVRLIRWMKHQGLFVTIVISFISLVLFILGIIGIRNLSDLAGRAKEATEIVEKALPQVSNFAQVADSLRKRFAGIDSLAGASSSEIERLKREISSSSGELERLKREISFSLEELAINQDASKVFYAELSKRYSQLENTRKIYEKEIKDLEQRRAQFRENQRFSILIQYSSDARQRARRCKDILASQGFQVELEELSELLAVFFRGRGLSEKGRYFDEELSQKAKEVAESLKPVATFNITKGEPGEKGEFSFVIRVLR